MKGVLAFAVGLAAACSLAFSQAPRTGPFVDTLLFSTEQSEEDGLRGLLDGRLDILLFPVRASALASLSPEALASLSRFDIPGVVWSLKVNPAPDAAPYTLNVGGRTRFNPLAIREVRFALNLLIDRRRIVAEVLGGAGAPQLTAVPPGQPGFGPYAAIPLALGLTDAGDERRAIADITRAIGKAAELPENGGRLMKGGQFWQFDGEDVGITFVLRSDDPEGMLAEGLMIADLIEKAGIRVRRLECGRKDAVALCSQADPAGLGWHLCTEAWELGGDRGAWEDVAAQMYAPCRGFQAGGGRADVWSYRDERIDSMAEQMAGGGIAGEKRLGDAATETVRRGLEQSTRVFVACKSQAWVAAKGRFTRPLLLGASGGIGPWSLSTADVKRDKDGKKVLRAAFLFSDPPPFSAPWNPVGPDGLADPGSALASVCVSDPAGIRAPQTGANVPWRAKWKNVKTATAADSSGTRPRNGIPVPKKAILFDPAKKRWVPVGAGVTAWSTATYSYTGGAWQSGSGIGIPDILYAQAFIREWSSRDGKKDRRYDHDIAGFWKPALAACKGLVVDTENAAITGFFDRAHPDKDFLAAQNAPFASVSASLRTAACAWEILEALDFLTAEASPSGTAWSFSADPAFTEVDLLDPACVKDIRAVLQGFIAARRVPLCLKGYASSAACVARYKAAVRFIDEHGHACIGNGPFMVGRVDRGQGGMELAAFRGEGYPFTAADVTKRLATTAARIYGVEVSGGGGRGAPEERPLTVLVSASSVASPSGAVKPIGDGAAVSLILFAPPGTAELTGVFVAPGRYQVVIPLSALQRLPRGSHAALLSVQLGRTAPALRTIPITRE